MPSIDTTIKQHCTTIESWWLEVYTPYNHLATMTYNIYIAENQIDIF
jgi:hypothetical protein